MRWACKVSAITWHSVLLPTRIGPSTAMYRGGSKRLAMAREKSLRSAEYLALASVTIVVMVNVVPSFPQSTAVRFSLFALRPSLLALRFLLFEIGHVSSRIEAAEGLAQLVPPAPKANSEKRRANRGYLVTSSAIVCPSYTLCPAAGTVFTTIRVPEGTVSVASLSAGGGDWLAILPTRRPAPTISLTASSSLRPARSGMTNELRSSGAASSTLILGVETLTAFAGGLWATI